MSKLILASMLFLGTLNTKAFAADPASIPQCQAVQDENGQDGYVCDNVNNQQMMSLMQDPDARRRCYRECSFRVFRFCLSWHVVCHGRY